MRAATDTEIEVARTTVASCATVTKQRDRNIGETSPKLVDVEVEQGITSAVPVEIEHDGRKVKPERKRRRTDAEVTAERALREALDCLGEIPPASNYIPPNTKAVTEAQWQVRL